MTTTNGKYLKAHGNTSSNNY